jgi:uncharacterized protein YggT (Ycf19 family)
MLLFLVIVKAICELVALSYLAMLVVGIFNWKARLGNPVYKLFDVLCSPMTKLARLITPAAVSDAQTRVVGFCLVFVIWMAAILELREQCRAAPEASYCVKKLGEKK